MFTGGGIIIRLSPKELGCQKNGEIDGIVFGSRPSGGRTTKEVILGGDFFKTVFEAFIKEITNQNAVTLGLKKGMSITHINGEPVTWMRIPSAIKNSIDKEYIILTAKEGSRRQTRPPGFGKRHGKRYQETDTRTTGVEVIEPVLPPTPNNAVNNNNSFDQVVEMVLKAASENTNADGLQALKDAGFFGGPALNTPWTSATALGSR